MEERGWKRVLVLGVGLAGIAALFLAAVLVVGSPDRRSGRDAALAETTGDAERRQPAKVSTPDEPRVKNAEEALREDARWYAKDMGVSLEEAIRRLEMQDDTLPSDLERAFRRQEPGAYAGLWLRHKPDYGLTIAFAGDPGRAMELAEPFVAGTRWEGTVEVKRVEASLKELNAARARTEKIFGRLNMVHDSGENVFKNRIEFGVASTDRFRRKLQASGLELPEHVVVKEGMAMPETALPG